MINHDLRIALRDAVKKHDAFSGIRHDSRALGVLEAIIAVEGGKAFIGDRISILPEKHIFYRRLIANGHRAASREAVRSGLAVKKWSPRRQYKGLGTIGKRYVWLRKAASIDPISAYESCSWGVMQIMGFHAKGLGYRNAIAMSNSFKSLEEQMLASLTLLAKMGLIGAIKHADFNRIERKWNGGGQNGRYAWRMGRYFATWQPLTDKVIPDRDGDACDCIISYGDRGKKVATVQAALNRELASGLVADGIAGHKTMAAIASYAKSHGLPCSCLDHHGHNMLTGEHHADPIADAIPTDLAYPGEMYRLLSQLINAIRKAISK